MNRIVNRKKKIRFTGAVYFWNLNIMWGIYLSLVCEQAFISIVNGILNSLVFFKLKVLYVLLPTEIKR